MKQFVYLTLCAFFGNTLVLGENCDKLGILLYEDLACKPKTSGGPCPTSYECKSFQAPNKCVVQGKTLNHGDFVRTNAIGFSCELGCVCNVRASNESNIYCAQLSCGEWSGLPPSPGCYRKYDLEACCSIGETCPPFTDTTKCTVDGIEYKAGERFSPKDSCHLCLCRKGFNGKFEAPYCRRSGCDAQIRNQAEIQKYCAPVYIKRNSDGEKVCCPSTWTCPDGSEVIRSSEKKSDLTCKYGEKILQLGDSFDKEIQYLHRPLQIKCECKVPPLLTCNKS